MFNNCHRGSVMPMGMISNNYIDRLAYNPITLKYDESEPGRQLKDKDDNSKVRQFVRAQNLDNRGNTTFNILTGE